MFIAIVLGIYLLCLALFGAAAFFLAKGIASVFGALARQWPGQHPPPAIALRVASWVCALLVLILLPMQGCSLWQVELYRQAIPPQFELTEVVHHDEVGGLREGCGYAVFRLSEENLARIRSRGLAYFETAHLGRDGDPYHQYQPWRATPAAEHDRHLFRGQNCAGNPPELLQQAERAARTEGAFFTTGHEQDLVVVPALGLLIYSFDG